MKSDKYTTSFTTGALLQRESVELAKLYLELGDWNALRDEVIASNLLQARAQATLKRTCNEIISRLKMLNHAELCYLVHSFHKEQAYVLWLALCRKYRIIAEFSIEVLRERFITLKEAPCYDDFDAFFNRKAEWNVELERITAATRAKLRQVLFKMLRQCEFLTKQNTLQSAIFSPTMVKMIYQNNPGDFLYFPVFETELKGMMQ